MSEGFHGQSMDNALLRMVVDTIRGISGGHGEDDERRLRTLGAMKQLSVFHASKVTAWRDALRGCIPDKEPQGGALSPDDIQCKSTHFLDCGIYWSVMDDLEHIRDQFNTIFNKLDTEIIKVSTERAASEDLIETNSKGTPQEAQSGCEEQAKDGEDQGRASFTNNDDTEGGLNFKDQSCDGKSKLDSVSEDIQKKMSKEWITVGLENSDILGECFIQAPLGVAEVLRCEVADALSCLMVSDSEELVSRVIRVRVEDCGAIRYPLTVAIPFCVRHRGTYRTIAVKLVDRERRASYLTPMTTESSHGGQRGSFAEVKVYSLGLFAVVSCLKREHFTVPTRGMSHKPLVDPRICLYYLPGSFTASVMVQYMIQPLDAVLLATIKSKSEAYRRVVSTSPLLCLAHPSSQPLLRPLMVTLPCPPNPDKWKDMRGQVDLVKRLLTLPAAGPAVSSSQQRRMLGSSIQSSKENPAELLSVLCCKDHQWSVAEGIVIQSHQNGLVSFELTENFDRLLVVRLLSPLQPCQLTSLAEDLVDSVRGHLVRVVIQHRQGEPRAVLVSALPSRELSWEMSRLQAGGDSAAPQTSPEICMREGDQLVLRLCGNVTCADSVSLQQTAGLLITFHSQRRNELLVPLTEVDPFGNYSSPHYKGAAVFYKATRGQAEWRGDKAVSVNVENLGEPVCTLPLTLPKRVRSIRRPVTPRISLCDRTDCLPDSLLLWLSGELSEEELGHLAHSLRLRRSSAQLVKLRAGDNLPGEAFRMLTMWRRELPASLLRPKASQLARCLARSGRPDLAAELLLRQAATSENLK
ncbi:death domain-containing protein 1 [Nerophis lumbriciformis]|uniref:death domain-containing protein 1 n=1 Tax=Nerophis lumbriciformis TaxID=546530 RepID=UPI003BAAB49F